MFEGKYKSNLSDEEITDKSDVVEITMVDFSSKQSKTVHITQEEFQAFLEDSDMASELFLGDD